MCTMVNVYYALDFSVSFKPSSIGFTLVIDMLALSAVLNFSIVNSFKLVVLLSYYYAELAIVLCSKVAYYM